MSVKVERKKERRRSWGQEGDELNVDSTERMRLRKVTGKLLYRKSSIGQVKHKRLGGDL